MDSLDLLPMISFDIKNVTTLEMILENPIILNYCRAHVRDRFYNLNLDSIISSTTSNSINLINDINNQNDDNFGGDIGGLLKNINAHHHHHNDHLKHLHSGQQQLQESQQNQQPSPNSNDFLINTFIILYFLVFLVGFFGNSMVIYVVLRFSKMQTVTNLYIFNLAIADEMFLIGLIFLITTFFYKYWLFGRLLCKIYMTITSINQFTSSLLLTVMSADRYIAVCHPINAPRYRTSFIAKFICLTVWTISALLMVPIFMYGNTLESKNTITCNIIWPESEPLKGARTFTLYSFTLGFFIPFLLIFCFYILVICRLRKVGPKKKSKEKKRSHRKVTYLVLTVISIYVLCCLPYWIGQLYIAFVISGKTRSNFTFIFNLLAGCLTYANSAVNPILYAFLSENFKKSFAKAFVCAPGADINAQLNAENSNFPKAIKPKRISLSTIKDRSMSVSEKNFQDDQNNCELKSDIEIKESGNDDDDGVVDANQPIDSNSFELQSINS
ncbi:Somatostatin receptor type 1 [Sarcoptes scabiei]|uniref:Somatostatin receptor type 1 n=1 Tax=Sarcoptes scabiei TaxID=52283 RepID=A0A834R309_SARSC|nr:Somatostatin receptor type 1 [Sarcoptes scabiei]